MNIILNSRIFWRKLATWSRAYLFSRFGRVGISEDIFGHLLNILAEFASMLRLVFGAEFAEKYYQLLVQNVVILRDLLNAQSANDIEAIYRNLELLYQNSDERAAYLSEMNPHWEFATWKNLIDAYIRYTIAEANTFITNDYERNIETFDHILAHTDLMGDYLAFGIYNFITSPPETSDRRISRERISELCITYDFMNTIYRMRLFWFEMETWTREFMISRFTGFGIANQVYDRLRKVPVEYIDLLRRYFDSGMVNGIADSINRHIDLIDDLVTAYQAGNIDEINYATRQLYQNVDEGAKVLSGMNPFLNQVEWRAILYGLIGSIIEELVSFLTEEYARNINIFNRLLDESEFIGNSFTSGLIEYITNRQTNDRRMSITFFNTPS